MTTKCKGLLQRLNDGEYVLVAEGFLFEFERRGYLRAGPFTPEVVIEHPDLVKAMHEEFAHAGSDVCLAFTFYGHREKLRIVGLQDKLEEMNRQALRLAKEVALKTNTLMAGNLCMSTCFNPDDKESVDYTKQCFIEQVKWCVEEGADFILAETFQHYAEARLALDVILEYGNGLPAVITIVPMFNGLTLDNLTMADACRKLEEAGAAVVGLNCFRGPDTLMPLAKEVRESCKGPVAALPVTYRTDAEHPTMQSLKGMVSGERAFPYDLDEWAIGRTTTENFTKECMANNIQYLGLCCGGSAHLLRTMAETLGRTPLGTKYSPKMELHTHFGSANSDVLKKYNISIKESVEGPQAKA